MNALTLYRNPLSATFGDLDKMLDAFFGDSVLDAAPASRRAGSFPVDVRETDNSYVVEAELPGFSEKDIQVSVDDGALVIEAKRESSKDSKEEKGRWVLKERSFEEVRRAFRLPEDADAEGIEASFRNGLLTLEAKKKEGSKRRSIAVKAK